MTDFERKASAWQRWVDRGATRATEPGERRAIVVTNEAATLVAAVSFAAVVQPNLHGSAAAIAIMVCQAATYLSVPFLAGFGLTGFARRFFFTGAVFWLTVATLVLGTDSHNQLYLITVAVGVWHMASPREGRLAALTTLAALAAFLAFALHPVPGRTGASAAEQSIARASNAALTVMILLGFSLYAFRRTREAEQTLDEARMRSDSLLLNILPETIAARLKKQPTSIADRFDEATILFADIVNFTVLSERVSPVALVAMLDRVFTRFDALCDRYGLEKIKTIGDAYMVAAGVPEPRSDHLEAIASMALDMGRVLAELQEDEAFAQLNIRIGIHTGPVVAGVIGQRKFVYDLWGDAVNTASRMESHGMPGRIHVSREVHDRLEEHFLFEPRGSVTIKGKGEMETWFLTGRR